jgi:hypothetical protein
LPESGFSFTPPLPSLTKGELYLWLNEKGLKELAGQFAPIEVFEHPQASDSKSRLNESEYWNKFEKMVVKAIDEYPAWKLKQKRVKIEGNLNEWVNEQIADNTREGGVIKKVLTEVFEINS